MTAQSEPMTDVEEAAYREAVARWRDNPNAGDARVVMRGAAQVLQMLDTARAEAKQIKTAVTYLQGPEECLERECEEYFDDNGDERPGVEYCSHLKAKALSVDEHLTVLTERDRLDEQRQAAIALVAHAYIDAGANLQEDGWPEWGPSVDGDDILKTLGAWGKAKAVATDA